MASVKIFSMDGSEQGTRDLNDSVFDCEPKEFLVKDVILALRSSLQQGTHQTKTRSTVRGGGAKPFRQKGTGRARQGTSRAPQMKGGATVFGPVPRSYKHNIPVRAKRQALCVLLSDRLRNDALSVLSGLAVEAPKTKPMAEMVDKLATQGRKTLIITAEKDNNILLSSRNIPGLEVRTAIDVNALDVISASNILLQEEAVAPLEERLS
jgi:large subunit ribosomal protein L4